MRSKIIFAMLVFCTLSLSYLIFLLTYPFNPVTLHKKPLTISKYLVREGDKIQVEMEFTKNMDIQPEVKWYLVNNVVIELATTNLNRPLGKQTRTVEVTLPEGLHEGKYHIQVDLKYPINRIRQITYSWDTEEFYVLGGEINGQ